MLLIDSIGIGTLSYVAPINDEFFADIASYNRFIGIYGGGVGLYGEVSVGVNTNNPRSILDFGLVGSASTIGGYFISPTITTVDRNKLSNNIGVGGTVQGAIIYNSTTKKHQGYGSLDNGSTFGWQDLY